MPTITREIVAGVDTHTDTHLVAVLDGNGRLLGHREFPASAPGYAALSTWVRSHGTVGKVGVEGTGAYGAGLTRHLQAEGVAVVEVPRPDRRTRRQRGKSDAIDAESAARAVLAGQAIAEPKRADGIVEAIRVLRTARTSALKAKTAATNALHGMLVTAPEPLRHQLRGRSTIGLVNTCARLRPDSDRLSDPAQATKHAMRSLAQRIQALTSECRELQRQLHDLTAAAAPATSAVFALGPDTVASLLITIGDNPDRLRSEAAFAHLCGVAPIPASSGRTTRHRLHRGGDRSANRALHIAAVVRMRYCDRTRAYVTRRTTEGLSKPEIIRCLKRYLAREVFTALRTDYATLTST